MREEIAAGQCAKRRRIQVVPSVEEVQWQCSMKVHVNAKGYSVVKWKVVRQREGSERGKPKCKTYV